MTRGPLSLDVGRLRRGCLPRNAVESGMEPRTAIKKTNAKFGRDRPGRMFIRPKLHGCSEFAGKDSPTKGVYNKTDVVRCSAARAGNRGEHVRPAVW